LDIRFVQSEIRFLELLSQELLLLPLFVEDRPPQGALGLVDFRMAGQISALIERGSVQGELCAAYALPGRPKLGFERIVLVGAGRVADFHVATAERVIDRMLDAADELKTARATIELPGRARDLLSAEAVMQIWLDKVRARGQTRSWTLIESAPAARRMATLSESEPSRRWGLPSPS
jgi:hypothetical protein